jgi:ubiquinone/menaquinone biosynthesis C-methylase UbiE
MPFDDASFDFIWCSEVLEHLFSPLAALKEIRRVLKPGGQFRCTVPYHGLLKNLGIALFAFERHYDPEYPHIRFFTKKSLKALVQRAGLNVTQVGACGSNLGLRDVLVKTNILLAATV